MSDHESSVLIARLTSLADELTPSADPVVQVRSARTRYRRQRRTRIATGGLVAAAAVLVLGVPAAVGSFSAAPERGEVARPSVVPPQEATVPGKSPAPAPEGEDARMANRWTDMLDERAERDARLGAVADGLRTALEGRPAPLSLTAPGRFGRCPDWGPALSSSLGFPMEDQRGPVGSGGPFCATGTNREQMVQQVDSEATQLDCYPTALPGTEMFSALALCEEDARTTWRLHFPDTAESVVWTLTVSVSDRYAGGDVEAVTAAVELLDATW